METMSSYTLKCMCVLSIEEVGKLSLDHTLFKQSLFKNKLNLHYEIKLKALKSNTIPYTSNVAFKFIQPSRSNTNETHPLSRCLHRRLNWTNTLRHSWIEFTHNFNQNTHRKAQQETANATHNLLYNFISQCATQRGVSLHKLVHCWIIHTHTYTHSH